VHMKKKKNGIPKERNSALSHTKLLLNDRSDNIS